MNKLEVKNVSKEFDGISVIDDVNIILKKGEIVSILGASGVGKSTLFNIISGLISPDKGGILLDGEDITNVSGKVSYMLQKDMLLPYRTIEDNVSLPLIIKGVKKNEARKEVASYFEEFGLAGTEKKWPSQLSGGMRQRAALLRTYMFSHNVALLDEPFSALDRMTKGKMHTWFLELMDRINLSTLFITHDIEEAILLSDRVYLLKGKPGNIISEIVIKRSQPRNSGFALSKEFLEYKKYILSKLQ